MAIVAAMVGRPREFDTDVVLEAAMRAFWENGYEATSLADLMKATGLHKGSLYQAFGDKHSLFLQSLRRYLADARKHELDIMNAATGPLQGIADVVHGMIDMHDDHCPAGCLAINTIIELAPHDSEVATIMDAHVNAMRTSLESAIVAGQAAGQIDKTRPPELLAAMVMTFMSGLAIQARSGMDRATGHQLIDAQLDTLK